MIQHPLGSGTKAAGSLLTDPVLLLIPGGITTFEFSIREEKR